MPDSKKVFITGISGQDGSVLAHLLAKDHKVYGLVRDVDPNALWRLNGLKGLTIVKGDLLDSASLEHNLSNIQPDWIFNMGAQSSIPFSFENPIYSCDVTGMGSLRLIEAVRQVCQHSRVYHASSSEQFGNRHTKCNENTPFNPITPYGVAKTFAHNIMATYRKSYNMFITCGIAFNHNHETKDAYTAAQKIITGVSEIHKALQAKTTPPKLILGNMQSSRDWGYAVDYCQAMIKMIQQPKPIDYVLASGKLHSIEDFVREAFKFIRIDDWQQYVEIDQALIRPNEVKGLIGNASKIHHKLGWTVETSFEEMVRKLMRSKLCIANTAKMIYL